MSDFLTQLLQAVITAAIPVCGAFLIQFLNRKSDQIAAETDSIELKALIAQVDDAVSKAVTYTTQDGARYRVWYENEQSVLDKLTLARMFGVTGVSLWRLGAIPASTGYDVWSAIQSQR